MDHHAKRQRAWGVRCLFWSEALKYQEFLEKKRHSIQKDGVPFLWAPEMAKKFQLTLCERSLYVGRFGNFCDTGLGKTLMQLTIAHNVVLHTNGRVLILTPLAVAFQFLTEAEKIGCPDVHHSKKGEIPGKIIVANYERIHLFNPNDFDAVILDESSILKNFEGKIRDQCVSFMKKIRYRFLSSATPSPNDFIELGNSSEALGHMGYMDMLSKFFKSNQGSIDSNNRNIGEKFYLKPHAERDFFSWVNQWASMVKRPSDLGFSDEEYLLPDLIVNKHYAKNNQLFCVDGQFSLFQMPARTMTEVRQEQKSTITTRCEMAAHLASGKTSVYWCNFNEESALISEIDRDAVEIKGGMTIERKEDILVEFAKGGIERLVTKAKMTSMGLNWQHCNHTVYFPTWSYEQYYQAIRRFYRFGQKREVTCEMVVSEGQERVIEALEQKTQKAKELFTNLAAAVNSTFTHTTKDFNINVKKPGFIK